MKFLPKLKRPPKHEDRLNTSRSRSKLLNRVTEREALAKLMNIIDASLERKQAILDAIDNFHNLFEGTKGVFLHLEEDEFKGHYNWLQESLRCTDQALEAALVYQQIMYSSIYTGISMIPSLHNPIDEQIPTPSKGGKELGRTLGRGAMEIGSELAKRSLNNCSVHNPVSRGKEAINTRNNFLLNRVSSAVGILLAGDLLIEKSHQDKNDSERYLCIDSIETLRATASLLKHAKMPLLPEEIVDTTNTRQSALDDLEASLKIFESELVTSL